MFSAYVSLEHIDGWKAQKKKSLKQVFERINKAEIHRIRNTHYFQGIGFIYSIKSHKLMFYISDRVDTSQGLEPLCVYTKKFYSD